MGFALLDQRSILAAELYSSEEIDIKDVNPQLRSIFFRSSLKQKYLTKSSNMNMMGE